MLKQKTMRSAVTVTLIISMIAAMMPSWYMNKSYGAENNGTNGPFTRMTTDYGVKNDLVSAVKVKLDSDVTVLKKQDYTGVMLLREDVSDSVYKYYLVGRKGEVIKTWQTKSSSIAPELEEYYRPDARDEGNVVKKGERVYSYHLMQIKDPDTGKYDVYNADTGNYYELQAERLSSYSYKEGAYLAALYDGEYAFVSPSGEILYKGELFKSFVYLTTNNNVCFFGAETDSGKYVIVSTDGKYDPAGEEYQKIESADSYFGHYDNVYEGNLLDPYVIAENDDKRQLINVSTGKKLADGMEFSSIGYSGDRVFRGQNYKAGYIMTDSYWFDVSQQLGYQESRVYGSSAAKGNSFAYVLNRDKNGNIVDSDYCIFNRYGEVITRGETIVALAGDYYVDYSVEGGYSLKSLKTGELVRTDLGHPTNGYLYAGNFVLLMNKRVEGQDPVYFWLNTDTGEVAADGLTNSDYCFRCDQKGSGYITLRDDASGLCGIIDTASGAFSGFVFDYDFESQAFQSHFQARGSHKEDGSGMILTTFNLDSNKDKIRVYNKNFMELARFDDAEIISVDSNRNYLIQYSDNDDDLTTRIIRSDGTLSSEFYLNYTTSLMDHHHTIMNKGHDKFGLSASDGSVILPLDYKFIGPEFNGITQVSDDPDFLDYWERVYSCGYVDYYGEWLIHGDYYTKGDNYEPGRNIVLNGSDGCYYFYDLNEYVEDLHSDDGTIYYDHKPVKEITEDDLYGDHYQYLNNEFYNRMTQRLWGDMNVIYGERSKWDNCFAAFISNMKEGGANSILNAMICDVTGEYYKQGELEEKIAIEYLKEISEDQSMMSDLVKGFNKYFKWGKRGYEIIESGFKNAKEERELAVMMQVNELTGNSGFTESEGLEIIRSTKTNWDKIDKIFKTAGKSLNAAEVAAMVCIEVSFSKYMISTLMDSISKDSELYRGLQRVRMKNNCPVEMLVAELLNDDVFSLVSSKMTSEGIGRYASLLAGTGGIQVGMATTVAGIGYYIAGSWTDKAFANSDEVISACIAICNQTTLSSALADMKSDMRSNNSGKGYEEIYPLIYKAYMISIKNSVGHVLKIAKKGGNREQLKEDYAKYEKYLSYGRYLDSCLKNANASLVYTLDNGKATITGYNKPARRSSARGLSLTADAEPAFINIPETIDGHEVEAVGKSAFKNDISIAGVYVPKGVKNIGDKAFEGCSNLTDVFFEEGLTSIGNGSFSKCSSLDSIKLPDSVQELGDSIFEGTDGVKVEAKDTALIDQYLMNNNDATSVKLPAEVTEITITRPADKQSYNMSEVADLELLSEEGENTVIADLKGMELRAAYDDGTEETVTEGFAGYFEERKLGENTIKVCYGGASTSFTVDVSADECTYEIAFVDERGIKIAESVTGTAMAGSEVTVDGESIEGYKLISESRSETIGAGNYFEVRYETIRKPSIGDAKITLSETSYEYNGNEKTPEVTVQYNEKTLIRDKDYTLEFESNILPGDAAVTVCGTGDYRGISIEVYTITKAANPMTVKGKTVKVKYSKVRRKKQIIRQKSAFTLKNNRGKVTYKMARYDKKAKKKIVIGKTGKVTVKKGLKKGLYKITVKVTAAGDNCYLSKSKTVTVSIKIK